MSQCPKEKETGKDPGRECGVCSGPDFVRDCEGEFTGVPGRKGSLCRKTGSKKSDDLGEMTTKGDPKEQCH